MSKPGITCCSIWLNWIIDTFLSTARVTIEEAGDVLPTTWNWYDTFGVMVAGSWLFAYAYCITFIAGEVKRPDKTIILSNLAAVLVPAFFMTLAGDCAI